MESLADFLGVNRDRERPAEQPHKKLSAKDLAREILQSPEYKQSLLDRITLGQLPAQVECLLYHYAWGKPVERIEMKDTTDDIDEMNIEECEQEAERLIEIARTLRQTNHVRNDHVNAVH